MIAGHSLAQCPAIMHLWHWPFGGVLDGKADGGLEDLGSLGLPLFPGDLAQPAFPLPLPLHLFRVFGLGMGVPLRLGLKVKVN